MKNLEDGRVSSVITTAFLLIEWARVAFLQNIALEGGFQRLSIDKALDSEGEWGIDALLCSTESLKGGAQLYDQP